MTHTFTLSVVSYDTKETVYREFHNFRDNKDGTYVYYRGGSNHPLEINLTAIQALESMDSLRSVGWTEKKDFIVGIS